MSVSVEKFYRHLYGGGAGLLALFSVVRTPGGKLDEDSIRTRYFAYPEKIGDALTYAAKESQEGREVWHCAHLLTKGRRVKENAVPVLSLWGDLDGAEVPNGSLKPTGIIESSPGHFHCYWRLSDEIPPELAEDLNKRLASVVGADPSGFDLSQLLRVPGTVNHKYPDEPVVKILELDGGHSYLPRELDEALPEIEAKREPRSRGASDEPPVVLDDEALRVWRGEEPKLKEDGAIDRSASLVKIGRAVYDAGGNRSVIEAAFRERDRSLGWNTYTTRPDAAERYAGIVDELEKNGRNDKAWFSANGKPPNGQDAGSSEQKEERRNQADRLIGYALEDVQELFVDQHGAPHALIRGEPVPLTSRCYS